MSLWLTEDKCLLIAARCVSCEKECDILVPLADLFKACPVPDLKSLNEKICTEIARITDGEEPCEPLLFNAEDMRFLHALKIGDEDATA